MAGQNKVEFSEVKCSNQLFNKILGVLGSRPYNEVAQLLAEIQQGFKPVLPTAAGAKEVKPIKKKPAKK